MQYKPPDFVAIKAVFSISFTVFKSSLTKGASFYYSTLQIQYVGCLEQNSKNDGKVRRFRKVQY